MQRFHRDGKTYWGGLHQELGLLIYDPYYHRRESKPISPLKK
jgi:hypothetical protein